MNPRLFLRLAAIIVVAFFSRPTLGYGDELSFGNPTVDEGAHVFFPIDLSGTPGDGESVAINLEITHSANLVFHAVMSSQGMIDAGKTVASFAPSGTTVRVVIYDLANTVIPDGALVYIGFTPSDDAINGNVVNLSFSEAVGAGNLAQEVSLTSTATFSKSIDDVLSGLDPTDPVDPDNDDESGTSSSVTKDSGGSGGCFMGAL